MVRYAKFLYLLLGVVLLYFVVADVDLADVGRRVGSVGWGMAVILGLYLAGFVIDSFTWLMALPAAPLNAGWLVRMWQARMVGEAFNNVMPAAGMGGEPVKAGLLKKYFGIGYREAIASQILAKTFNMIALVGFLACGFVLMLGTGSLGGGVKALGAAGFAAVCIGTGMFFFIQRLRISSLAGTWMSRWRLGRRIEGVLHHVHDMEERLTGFYSRHRARFAGAVALAFVVWLIGILEIYYTMRFLGRPVSMVEAWIIEAVAQMVRTSTFFIPASLGAQEGAFLLVCSAITGSPQMGVAVALVRRVRELTWILAGALVGWIFSFRAEFVPPAAADGTASSTET